MNRKALEKKLVKIAELDSTYRSSKAMNILRNYFDSTYKWCQDCDFMVVKEKYCCLNLNTHIMKLSSILMKYLDIKSMYEIIDRAMKIDAASQKNGVVLGISFYPSFSYAEFENDMEMIHKIFQLGSYTQGQVNGLQVEFTPYKKELEYTSWARKKIEPNGFKILEQAVRRLSLSLHHLAYIFAGCEALAVMEGSDFIKTEYVAEMIQYQYNPEDYKD